MILDLKGKQCFDFEIFYYRKIEKAAISLFTDIFISGYNSLLSEDNLK